MRFISYYVLWFIIITGIIFSVMIIIKTGGNKVENSKQITGNESRLLRQAAVAGSFYPSDKKILDDQLTLLLSQTGLINEKGRLTVLIVPHAGIDYSGSVAAWGFRQIENKSYKRVIIIGAPHRSYIEHIAVYPKGVWETPLGKVEVDEALADNIIEKESNILSDSSSHEGEHSLEVELIFLQKVLKDFKIVPILVGETDEKTLDRLAQKISENIDSDTLLVVSTDLSHYPTSTTANVVDQKTIKSILSGNEKNFMEVITGIESGNYQNVETAACGFRAVRVGLKVANLLEIRNIGKIKYQNSGDITGDNTRVVGYASIGFWTQDEIVSTRFLDDAAQKEALSIARNTLDEFVQNKKKSQIKPINGALFTKSGAFVTLRKDGNLRGCVGRFEPNIPLYQVIQEMTIAAASEDRRFLPVEKSELKDIKIEISVLTPKKSISDWTRIKLGREGVVLAKDNRSGTFLPQVAAESGWSLEEFLGQLCSQKAGLPSDCYKDKDTKLYTFEAQVFE